MKKYLIFGALLLVAIATIVVVLHLRNNRREQTVLEKYKQLEDSAAFYRMKQITDSINWIESTKKLTVLENDLDTLRKNIADSSFVIAVRKSALRAKMESDHSAKLVRDSLGRLSTGSGSH